MLGCSRAHLLGSGHDRATVPAALLAAQLTLECGATLGAASPRATCSDVTRRVAPSSGAPLVVSGADAAILDTPRCRARGCSVPSWA
jgi:hypothetical protein